MAAKLLTAFAGHVELLTNLQRGGNPTVRVEHVHVHPGKQAIVGHVTPGGKDAKKRSNTNPMHTRPIKYARRDPSRLSSA